MVKEISEPAQKDFMPNWEVGEPGFRFGYEYPESGYQYRIAIGNQVFDQDNGLFTSIERILNTKFTPELTLNLVRVVMTKNILAALPNTLKNNIEAIIDLQDSGSPDLSDCVQITFSRKSNDRAGSMSASGDDLARVNEIFSKYSQPTLLNEPIKPDSGYSFHQIAQNKDENLMHQYAELFERVFDEDSSELISDPTNVILVCVEENTVVGGIYAYRDVTHLSRDGKDVILVTYEISGAVIDPNHRGKRLYSLLLYELTNRLAQIDNPPAHIVFAFANMASDGMAIVRSVAKTGGTTTIMTAQKYGLSIHPLFTDTVGDQIVNDLVVYMSGNQLRSLVTAS